MNDTVKTDDQNPAAETGNAAAVQESATLTPTESAGITVPVQPASSESTISGEAGNGVSAENVAASGSSLSSTEAATIGATVGANLGELSAAGVDNGTPLSQAASTGAADSTAQAGSDSGAELGSKSASLPVFKPETKEKAESLLQEIEEFLKHAEAEAVSVGSTLWHLIVHLRDARIHTKDVIAN